MFHIQFAMQRNSCEKELNALENYYWYSSMNVDKVVLIGNVHHCFLKIEMPMKMIGGDNRMLDQTFARSS